MTAALAQCYEFLAVEDLRIPNLTKSARGTVEGLGVNVMAKRQLTRRMPQQLWGRIYRQLEYKAASAGNPFVRVNPA